MKHYNIVPYRAELKQRARHLRKDSTFSEILLWNAIKRKALGVEFHRQVPLLNFIVDFYCHELHLALEVDGNTHDYDRDVNRDEELASWGVHVLRIEDFDVKDDLDMVINLIKEEIERRREEK